VYVLWGGTVGIGLAERAPERGGLKTPAERPKPPAEAEREVLQREYSLRQNAVAFCSLGDHEDRPYSERRYGGARGEWRGDDNEDGRGKE